MGTSFSILPGAVEVSKTVQGFGDNIQLNQSDNPVVDGFEALLVDIRAALSEPPPAVLPGGAVAAELLTGLQELPEGGKLLPVLQDVLDSAVVNGMDGEQLSDTIVSLDPGIKSLLDKLPVSLETLEPGEIEQVAQSLSALAQQLNYRLPVTTASTAGEGAVSIQPATSGSVTPQGQLAELIQQQLRPQAAGTQQVPNASDVAVSRQTLSEILPQATQTGQDKPSQQLQQQPQAAEGRQGELTLLMAAFKRQRMDGTHRVSTDNQRPDILAVAGANTAVPVTGSGAQASALPTVSIPAQVGQANWDQAVGERIQWMVGQKIQSAQVKLSPANLGPMEIRVQVQHDQASIQFAAPNAMVREALEAALPRLRDMFEASGVELVDVDVSGQSFAEQKATGDEGDGNHQDGHTTGANMSTELVLESEVVPLENAGRLDLFA